MKYCIHCGTQLSDDAAFCTQCGKPTAVNNNGGPQYYAQNVQTAQQDNYEALKIAINVFLIIACVVMGIATLGIGLSWCLPMTFRIRERMRANVPVGMALKVCTLIFVNSVAGILLLVLDDGS
ncbi:MAG: zinc-ribbon domain-containing protein [Clostridia bacterium]|nr:zinc-ribbon domain-containing protein [Clostridia bacterium]